MIAQPRIPRTRGDRVHGQLNICFPAVVATNGVWIQAPQIFTMSPRLGASTIVQPFLFPTPHVKRSPNSRTHSFHWSVCSGIPALAPNILRDFANGSIRCEGFHNFPSKEMITSTRQRHGPSSDGRTELRAECFHGRSSIGWWLEIRGHHSIVGHLGNFTIFRAFPFDPFGPFSFLLSVPICQKGWNLIESVFFL